MYQLKKEELLSLLENMRQIRQKAGEMISFLEHMMQLQPISPLRELPYNPDDYLENTVYDELDQVQQSPGLRPCWRNNDDHLAGGSLNSLRHTFATNLVNGVKQPDGTVKALTVRQVADLLGHSTTQVTEMYYVKKDTSMLNGITNDFCL